MGIDPRKIPLIGGQQDQRQIVASQLFTATFINMMGVVAGVRLREKSEAWAGAQEDVTPESIAKEAKKLALAAVFELTGAKLEEGNA